jgi:hypothetical protein
MCAVRPCVRVCVRCACCVHVCVCVCVCCVWPVARNPLPAYYIHRTGQDKLWNFYVNLTDEERAFKRALAHAQDVFPPYVKTDHELDCEEDFQILACADDDTQGRQQLSDMFQRNRQLRTVAAIAKRDKAVDAPVSLQVSSESDLTIGDVVCYGGRTYRGHANGSQPSEWCTQLRSQHRFTPEDLLAHRAKQLDQLSSLSALPTNRPRKQEDHRTQSDTLDNLLTLGEGGLDPTPLTPTGTPPRTPPPTKKRTIQQPRSAGTSPVKKKVAKPKYKPLVTQPKHGALPNPGEPQKLQSMYRSAKAISLVESDDDDNRRIVCTPKRRKGKVKKKAPSAITPPSTGKHAKANPTSPDQNAGVHVGVFNPKTGTVTCTVEGGCCYIEGAPDFTQPACKKHYHCTVSSCTKPLSTERVDNMRTHIKAHQKQTIKQEDQTLKRYTALNLGRNVALKVRQRTLQQAQVETQATDSSQSVEQVPCTYVPLPLPLPFRMRMIVLCVCVCMLALTRSPAFALSLPLRRCVMCARVYGILYMLHS